MYLHLLKIDQSNYCYCIIETFHYKTSFRKLSFSDKYCI